MSAAEAHPLCVLCSLGRSNDRLLLHCSSRACASGSWFHLDCIGAAIVSRNVKKAQAAWLCPWCLLQQSSSLSERQLLALTLQVSQLDSLRPKAFPSVDHSILHVATRSDPRLGAAHSSSVCHSNGTPPPASNSSSKKKRGHSSVSALLVPCSVQDELAGTCAKCRPLRLPNGMRHPKRIIRDLPDSCSSKLDNGSAASQLNPQACQAPDASSSTCGVGFGTPSDLRSARASFRRSSSSLLAEFDSSALKFSSSLSFKNPSAFSQCWRQGRSQMHGWGLFANEFIPPGQRITEYTGELLRPCVSDLREMRYRAEGLRSTYFFRLDGSFVIDATRKGNVARYVNHSCGPNCEPRLVVADGKHHIVLSSKTAINKGEELCYDYKLPLDGTEQPCLCGSPVCRGVL